MKLNYLILCAFLYFVFSTVVFSQITLNWTLDERSAAGIREKIPGGKSLLVFESSVDLKFDSSIEVLRQPQKKDGRYYLFVDPGPQVITLQYHGNYSIPFAQLQAPNSLPALKEGEVKYFIIEVKKYLEFSDITEREKSRGNIVTPIGPNVSDALVSISVSPSDLMLEITERNDRITRITREAGVYRLFIKAPGDHVLFLRHPEFDLTEIPVNNLQTKETRFFSVRMPVEDQSRLVSDLVRVTFRMNQSDVFIRWEQTAPVPSQGRNAVFNVPKGVHRFQFIKEGYSELEQTVNAQEDQIIDIALKEGSRTSALSLPGFVIVNSQPSGAQVYLNRQRVGITPYQGRQLAGAYNLSLSYPSYHEHDMSFNLEEGATVTLPTVVLKPRFGYLNVNSTPQGADVLLNGKLIGVTPLSKEQINSGNHELVVRMPLYHTHEEQFSLEDAQDKYFDIKLNDAFGELSITSDPSGADVWIDGKNVGKTPYLSSKHPVGSYNIRLTKDLFSDAYEQDVRVTEGRKTERFVPLNTKFGVLDVSAEHSSIYINNDYMGTGKWAGNLSPGQYKVRASRNLHGDDERDVFILIGQTEKVVLVPKPKQGALLIETRPFDAKSAEIFINGQRRSETTPAVIPLLIGEYTVTVRKPGYVDGLRTVTVSEGKQQELVFNLQTFQGSLLQQSKKYQSAKYLYGTATLIAIGFGGYYSYSWNSLAKEYPAATTDATAVYDRLERHYTYSFIAFGAAVPFGIMAIIKNFSQKRTERKVQFGLTSSNDIQGFRLKINF